MIHRSLRQFSRVAAMALLPLESMCAQTGASETGRGLDSTVRAVVRRAEGRGFSGVVLVERETPRRQILARAGAERGQRVRAESRFWISSMAKQFVSAAVLACVEAGTVRLDAPIGTYLANVPMDKQGDGPSWSRVVLRELKAVLDVGGAEVR
jgi:CubicO group peptidase (beta-lactamase class C family)